MRTVCPTNLTVSAICSALNNNHCSKSINVGTRTIYFNKMDIPKNL